ncbi:helix-turn-helix domain-containing protein [Streptomyces monomycini]|uniref:helix-turn-helix domain-containing protein n=1 Tax=Streptomyces monomycini TaxID=371720 RepID=UPI0004AB7186|nr:helix-turn-helix transcriptional regulator [Streptomyces monomycini]
MAGMRIPKSRTAYGEELKAQREAAGLTQEKLSELAIMSRTHIAHIEAGRRKPSSDDARRLDQVLGTSGVLARFLPTLDGKLIADDFEQVRLFEQQTTMIREYGATLVPGLLQTEAYARAVFASFFPPKSREQCDNAVVTRLRRAKVLDAPNPPVLWELIDEAVLRRPVGGPAVMAAQLRHIGELGDRERVRLHVLPFSVGAHPLLESDLMLLCFDDAPPIAYVEALYTGALHDDPVLVRNGQTAYALALSDAMSHADSLALIKSVAEEYEHDER